MHREILHGGYDPQATELTGLLDTGRFNCASATVLFNALAADCGLDARGVELPRHAFSELLIGDRPLTIETTCPTWFHIPQATGQTTAQTTAQSSEQAVGPADCRLPPRPDGKCRRQL